MKTNRKNAKKRLHKGKKIVAKKPLFAPVEHGSLTGAAPKEFLTVTLKAPVITSVQ